MTTVWRIAPAPSGDYHVQTTSPPVLGRRHRARSADTLRSSARSSDRSSSSSSIHRDWSTSSNSPDSSDPPRHPDKQHRLHHHRHPEQCCSDSHINHHHHPHEKSHRQYHSHQELNHHHYHHHHHHHHHHKEDEDRPLRRRRHKHRSGSQNSLPSTSSDSNSSSRSRRGSVVPRNTLNLSLCGCGFVGVYHLGVVSCLLKHGPTFLASLDRVAGASAGALAAALLVTSPTLKNVETSTEMVTSLAKSIRRKPLGALTPGYRMADDLEMLLDKLLPLDAHEVASGKLYISLTDVKTKKNEVVSEFASRQELIQTLVASCHIPVYSGAKYPYVKDKQYCDGGLSNNLMDFTDGRTVTVSPFSGKQDIGPRDTLNKGVKGYYINIHNLDVQLNLNNVRRFSHAFFPPRRRILQQYLELGHKHASLFLVREGLYEIAKPGDKKPMVYESSV